MNKIKKISGNTFKINGNTYSLNLKIISSDSGEKFNLVSDVITLFSNNVAIKTITIYDESDNIIFDPTTYGETESEQAKFYSQLSEIVNFKKGGDNGEGLKLSATYDTYASMISDTNEDTSLGTTALVKKATGVLYVNRKKAGIYHYTTDGWEWVSTVPLNYVTEKSNGALLYDNSKIYFKGNLIFRDGNILRCKLDFTSIKEFEANDWEDVVLKKHWVASFTANSDNFEYYGGLNSSKQWQVNKYNDLGRKTSATNSNNSTYIDLDSATGNYLSLNYE